MFSGRLVSGDFKNVRHYRDVTQFTRILLWTLVAGLGLPDWASGQEDDRPVNFVEDVTNAGTSAAAFLEIGVGGRAQAMGNAGVALAHDASSMFWNPAAASALEGSILVSFDHTAWFANSQLDYVAAVLDLPRIGVVGISVLNFQIVDQAPVRTILQPEGTGEFYSASDLALSLTYAARLTPRFMAGISGKIIQESLWNEQARAFAFDLGMTYHTNLPGLSVAAGLANFGTGMRLEGRDLRRPFDDDPRNFSNDKLNVNLQTDTFSLPLLFRFGIAYQVEASLHQMTFAADVLHPSDNSESVNAGLEYTFMDVVSFRAGLASYFEKDRIGGYTFGMGLHHELLGKLGMTVDYAYATWGVLNATHRFTVTLARP